MRHHFSELLLGRGVRCHCFVKVGLILYPSCSGAGDWGLFPFQESRIFCARRRELQQFFADCEGPRFLPASGSRQWRTRNLSCLRCLV